MNISPASISVTKTISSERLFKGSSQQASLDFSAHMPSRKEYDFDKTKSAMKIMEGYDISNISLNEFNDLAKKLRDSGAITDEQLLDITAPYFMEYSYNESTGELVNTTDFDAKRNLTKDFNQLHETRLILNKENQHQIAHSERVTSLINALAGMSAPGIAEAPTFEKMEP